MGSGRIPLLCAVIVAFYVVDSNPWRWWFLHPTALFSPLSHTASHSDVLHRFWLFSSNDCCVSNCTATYVVGQSFAKLIRKVPKWFRDMSYTRGIIRGKKRANFCYEVSYVCTGLYQTSPFLQTLSKSWSIFLIRLFKSYFAQTTPSTNSDSCAHSPTRM